MRKTYQHLDQACFTRKFDKFEQGVLYLLELFSIKSKFKVRVYIHYPEQAIRTLLGMFQNKDIVQIMPQQLKKGNTVAVIQLTQISVLRKRHDAIPPCDPDPKDDSRFWNFIFQGINCVPPYLKMFVPENSTLSECKNSSQLHEIKRGGALDRSKIMSAFKQPCNEMTFIINTHMKQAAGNGSKNTTKILIKYMDQRFQEIKNERDFAFEMVWSTAGGFIGIFLGYSLLQVPELLIDGLGSVVKRFLS